MNRILCIFLLLSLVACSSKENAPSNVLPDSKMKSVLWDVMRAEFLAQHNARKDSTINLNAETRVLTEKVFEIHKISAKDFDRSYNWYTAHPDQMQLMLDSLYIQKQRELNPPPLDSNAKNNRLLKPSIQKKSLSHE
ncbi:MAG: DUF4296 domain-containing protein [Ginsengibacter sp.]